MLGLDENPRQHQQYGYKPGAVVRFLRLLADVFIAIFRLNGNWRLATEIQQKINPVIKVDIGGGIEAVFRTGHGRLVWHARTILGEERLMIEWLDSFDNDDVFFDIGANIGKYTIYAALKHKDLRAFCLEPELNNIQTIYENLYFNDLLGRCVIVPYGVSDKEALEPFHIREMTKAGALNNIGSASPYEIDRSRSFVSHAFCIALDSFIERYGLPSPTKVKIDVDGNEYRVLCGMKEALKRSVKELYIELDVKFSDHRRAIALLEECGFGLKEIENTGLLHDKEIGNYLFIKVQP